LKGGKSTCDKFYEQFKEAIGSKSKNQNATYTMRKISSQQVPWKKLVSGGEKINIQVSRREQTTCNKCHEQKSVCNKFREWKSERNRFHEKNQFHKEKNKFTSFTKRKINMQKVSLARFSAQQVPWTKSVLRGVKSM